MSKAPMPLGSWVVYNYIVLSVAVVSCAFLLEFLHLDIFGFFESV